MPLLFRNTQDASTELRCIRSLLSIKEAHLGAEKPPPDEPEDEHYRLQTAKNSKLLFGLYFSVRKVYQNLTLKH